MKGTSEEQRLDYTEVYAWGSTVHSLIRVDDTFGQLGISSEGIGKSYSRPKFCSFNIMIKEVACGEEHTALITSEGFLYTMGNNFHGRLGLGDKALTHSSVPCLVESLLQERIARVSCGLNHSVAVTGTVRDVIC